MNKQLNMQIGVEGYYTLRIIRPDGSVRREERFKNLITNSGMDQLGNGGGGTFGIPFIYTGCKVGTGTTVPAFTDQDLAAPIATVGGNESSTESFVEGTPAYWKSVKVYRFATGVAAGNLSEVGVFDVNGKAFSRALITDSGGTPITITVLSDEILDVTYELRSYIDKNAYTFNLTIAGVVYTLTVMPMDISAPVMMARSNRSGGGTSGISNATAFESNVLGTVYQSIPAGGATTQSNTSVATYTSGTYYLDITYTWDTGMANYATGIGALTCSGAQTKWKIGFSPKIPKTSFKTFSLTVRLSWARYP